MANAWACNYILYQRLTPHCCSASSPQSPSQLQAMPENPPTGISSEDLLAGNLRPLLRVDKSNDEKLTLIYRCVTAYICIHGAPELQAERLVNENQFKANIGQQESQFLELFKKAIAGSANSNDRMELLKHSM